MKNLSRARAGTTIAMRIVLGLACASLGACSTSFLGTPDTSSAPIPPPRASPFSSDGAGSSAPAAVDNGQPLSF